MSEPLQKFGFRESPYLRPTQRWVCGNTAHGNPCHVGPDRHGRCPGSSECRPRKEGDRWMCARSQFSGGACEFGPNPDGTCCRPIPKCQPVRSVRARRGTVVRWVSSVTIGILLLGLSLAGGVWVADPGDLTNQHTDIGDCGTCHSAFEKGVRGWVHAALGASTASNDSERCITCHQLGDDATQPHSISSEAAQRLTESARRPTGSGGALFVRAGAAIFGNSHLSGEIACMSCHREHQGADFDLAQMANENCMSCHTTRFDSFSSGHPDFLEYPYERRTRITFDHASHISKHFQDDDYRDLAPKGCNSCHQPDPVGRTMQVSGFEQACRSCHLGQIVGDGRASAKGILVLGVPGIDVETLYDRGVSLGEWPEDAEETVSPFAELLLSADPKFLTAYQAVRDHDLLDLADADDVTLKQVADVAWSFKELVLDLTTRGAGAFRERLESVIGRPLDEHESTDLVAMIPVDMILNAQRNWFPSLAKEVTRHHRGQKVANPDVNTKAKQVTPVTKSKPVGADNDLLTDGKDDDLLTKGADDNLLTDGKDDDLLSKGADNDLLTDGKDDDLLTKGTDDNLLKSPDDGLLGGTDVSDKHLGAVVKEGDALADKNKAVTPEDWMAFGGWYRDEFVLRYRPTGHSDRFMFGWINVSSEADRKLPLRVFDALTSENAPGACSKCHSIDQTTGLHNSLVMNWTGRRVDPLTHSFTFFSHTSHFSLLDEKGCSKCHQVDNKSDFMSSFDDQDPTTFSSNFAPMQQFVCSECHETDKAGDNCLSCHNYHIGSFQSTDLVGSRMTTDRQ